MTQEYTIRPTPIPEIMNKFEGKTTEQLRTMLENLRTQEAHLRKVLSEKDQK